MNKVWKVTWVETPHRDLQVSKVVMVPVTQEEWKAVVKNQKESKK